MSQLSNDQLVIDKDADIASLGITFDYNGYAMKVKERLKLKKNDFYVPRSKVREDLTKVSKLDFEKFRQDALKKNTSELLVSRINKTGGGFDGLLEAHRRDGDDQLMVDIDIENDNDFDRIFQIDHD